MAFTNVTLATYFKQRMVELYDRNTLDSYSVRTCNTMSMLYEMKEILNGWIAGNVKRGETVSLCVDECVALLEKDCWLDCTFYDKTKFKDCMVEYAQSVKKVKDAKDKKEKDYNEARYLLFLVDKCISLNKTSYLTALIRSLRTILLTPKTYNDNEYKNTFGSLDTMLSFLATELLRRGYSKTFLYKYFLTIKKDRGGLGFDVAFEAMQNKFSTMYLYDYAVIIRLHFKSSNIPQMANMSVDVSQDYMNVMNASMSGFSGRAINRRFYIATVKAPDTNAALQKARLQLSKALDRNNMGQLEIENRAIVAYRENANILLYWELYYDLDNKTSIVVNAIDPLAGIMQNIESSTTVSKEIKGRLSTALRHLRVGDSQDEIGQRFLNYWIGLEFIFATARSNDSTFSRMKEWFPQLKTIFYLKQNVTALDRRLTGRGLIAANTSMGNITEAEMDAAFTAAANDELLKYRIKSMKGHLHSKENTRIYLKQHIQNLEWHLSRIYHLRNELVHEAAIKESIVGVTVNLRTYLVFMLNLLLQYCDMVANNAQGKQVVMEHFFWHYDLQWKKITPNYDKKDLMNILLPVEYVK